MKIYLALFCVFIISFVYAFDRKGLNADIILKVHKTDVSIRIDGIIDDVWASADSIDRFIQLSPYHGQEPSERTVVKILTTEKSLYGLIIAYSQNQSVLSLPSRHDNTNVDVISFMFDTFGDKKSAYKFAVSAGGGKGDCRLLDDARNRDYSWDGVWNSVARVYNWGYVVEVEIPYRTIQYDENLDVWGFDVDRWMPGTKEDVYLCAYNQNEGQRVSQFATLKFVDFKPNMKGLNLELYPVGLNKTSYLSDGKYKSEFSGGFDLFYNPSPQLTILQTVYPDYAQIEADPYNFNISRYESYFGERRPFFSEGNEVFMPSGRERNSGFYSPMELLYTRRIGRKLPDGSEVPLISGTKIFGRYKDYEYGSFFAVTGEQNYMDDDEELTEPQSYFSAVRFKKNIFNNSTIGVLLVNKSNKDYSTSVLDIDGAIRETNWQIAYQFARSFRNNEGDYAASIGYRGSSDTWSTLLRARHVGENFKIRDVGFVPWVGSTTMAFLTGPSRYYETGNLRRTFYYSGFALDYNKSDAFLDYSFFVGLNHNYRSGLGFEGTLSYGDSKDEDVRYNTFEANFSSWYWNGKDLSFNFYAGYAKTYNFAREYLSFYSWSGISFDYRVFSNTYLGTYLETNIEGDPDYKVEEITFGGRPYISYTPFNDFNCRIYVDNVFKNSTQKFDRVIVGFLVSYSFAPKSWLYLAFNEIQSREYEEDSFGKKQPMQMKLLDRVMVFKFKYLYYL